jgi:hypothetical protein
VGRENFACGQVAPAARCGSFIGRSASDVNAAVGTGKDDGGIFDSGVWLGPKEHPASAAALASVASHPLAVINSPTLQITQWFPILRATVSLLDSGRAEFKMMQV